MDVSAAEGTSLPLPPSLPGIRLRDRPTQVMPNQKKVKARRKRRKELVLIQICLFGGLLLLVKGFSYLAENSGEWSLRSARLGSAFHGAQHRLSPYVRPLLYRLVGIHTHAHTHIVVVFRVRLMLV